MIKLFKYHALGNDYLILDPVYLDEDFVITPEFIKKICDRNTGVGSDGILYGPLLMNRSMVNVRIYNPDGSEAEKSGNGIRIFASYLRDSHYLGGIDVKECIFSVGKNEEQVQVSFLSNGNLRAKIGKYSSKYSDLNYEHLVNQKNVIYDSPFVSNSIYLSEYDKFVDFIYINIGNPHCVVVHDQDISLNGMKKLLDVYGPILESHIVFPNKVNVQFVKVLDSDNIQIEIWERGAGYTLSSGTSSVASVCACYLRGFINNSATVHMHGGKMHVTVDLSGECYLEGSVNSVMSVELTRDFYHSLFL